MSTRKRAVRNLILGVVVAVVAGCGLYNIFWTPTDGKSPEAQMSAPEFSLSDHVGKTHALKGLLNSGPAVVVFYRGYW